MVCPYCQTKNRADATFCIECGTPLDEENALQQAAKPPRRVNPEAATFDLSRIIKPLSWPWPMRLVVLLAVVALIFNAMSTSGQRANSELYHAAKQAQAEHHWHTAAQMFKQLADRSYFDASAQYAQVQSEAAKFEEAYGKGSHAENAGQKVMAAYYYAQANAIEPGYYAVDVTLARLRRENGRLLYRVNVGGDRAGLYVAEADGGMALKIPESNAESVLLATSPDGRYVAFSDKQGGVLHLYVKDTVSYDTYQVHLSALQGTGRYPVQNVVVAFLNGGANLIAIDGGGFGYTNNEPGRSTSAWAYNVRLDNGQVNAIGVVDAVAYPNYYDKQVYYTDNTASLRTYDIDSNISALAFTPDDHIHYLQLLKGDQLLYCTYGGVAVGLYTVTPAKWEQPRKLAELSYPDRPYGFLNPQVIVAPNDDRLLLWLRSRNKGMESYLLSLAGDGAAKVLRYDAATEVSYRAGVSFSSSSLGLLFNMINPPQGAQTAPRSSLTALMDQDFFFGTYPIIENDSSQTVKAAGFLTDGDIYYVTSQNGATREQVMGDIMVAPVNFPTSTVKLGEVNTDTLNNWQPVILMPDMNTLMYAGKVGDKQGIYIGDLRDKPTMLILPDAIAFWHLGGK